MLYKKKNDLKKFDDDRINTHMRIFFKYFVKEAMLNKKFSIKVKELPNINPCKE